MTLSLSLAARNMRLQALQQTIDSHASAAKLLVYGGVKPTPGAAANPANLIATVTLAKPSCTVNDDLLEWLTPAEGKRVSDLDVSWVRIVTGDDQWVLDGTASVVDGGGDFQFDTVEGNVGAFIRVASGGISEP